MVNVAVFASGNGSNFEALVKKQNQYQVSCLIVDQEHAYAIERAKKLNIPYYVVQRSAFPSRKTHEEEIIKILKPYKIDYICLAGYMRILSDKLICSFPNRILNIHPSLLPAFPGKHAIEDAYEHGVKVTGVTIFFIDQGIDTGRIISQEIVYIKEDMTLKLLEEEIHQLEHIMYSQTLEKLIGGIL